MPIRVAVGLLVAVLSLSPPALMGQQPVEVAFADPQPHFVAAWAPKKAREAERSAALTRRLALKLADASLDDALRALTREAGLNITYSPALLPPGRRVTISAGDIAVVTALTEILFRSGLDVVVDRDGALALVICRHPGPRAEIQDSGTIVGTVTDQVTGAPIAGATVTVEGTNRIASTDSEGRYRIAGLESGSYTARARYIGYAPLPAAVTLGQSDEITVDFRLEKSVQRLDEVVVTGTVTPTEVKAIPTPISIISADEIQSQNVQRVDQLFRGQVPGTTSWDQPSRDFYSVVSVRGANSLFLSNTVKTFIDGVETAFPVFLATIDPQAIDRVELTRGPQASTLYGSDASGGVLQIFTKKGRVGLLRPQVNAKLSLGVIDNTDMDGTAARQDHSLSVVGGSATSSYHVGGSYLRTGEWTPSYASNGWNANAGAQTSQGALSLSLSARYSAKEWDDPWLVGLRSYTRYSRPPFQHNGLRQQTYGLSAGYRATSAWHHDLSVGYDQTRQDYFLTQPRLTTPADSFLVAYIAHLEKVSLLYHSTVELVRGRTADVTLTAGLNHAEFLDAENFTGEATRVAGSLDGISFPLKNAANNTGYFAQVRLDLAEALFITGGIRAERNGNFGRDLGTAWSPRVGLAYVREIGSLMVKGRASYGESIRAPLPHQGLPRLDLFTNQLASPDLGPERQRGVDGGVELYFGTRASLGVTYFDQDAVDLIDFVLVDGTTDPPSYQYQNVGRIKNKGWELEGRWQLGRLELGGTFSSTRSTVRRLAAGYAGDYRVGDRIRGIPRRSAGAHLAYAPLEGTRLSASLTHLGSWTEYDYVSLFGVFFGSDPYRGSDREYWMRYPSVTKVAVGVSQQLTPNVAAFLRLDNIGNNRRFEADNINPPMGRIITTGAQLSY
jgi:outer membrane receptor protein involved in Fe transport